MTTRVEWDSDALGARLRAAREKHGVNMKTAARLLGMTPQRMGTLETGEVEAKARDVALYARLTGADPVELLMGDDRDPIAVPDVPESYARPNGGGTRAGHPTARKPAHSRPPQPKSDPGPTWRPSNIGRDIRPVTS